MKLTQARLKELLKYDPDTGEFTRTFKNGKTKVVGYSFDNSACRTYVLIGLDSQVYYAQYLAWLWVTGEFPIGKVHHMNGFTDDNSFANLQLKKAP